MSSAQDRRAREGAFTIGKFTIKPDRNLVVSPGQSHAIEPRIMDVLCVLAAKSGDVVTRDELIDRIWRVNVGADESLTRAISILRKTFREGGESEEVIETIPKRGYRLALPVIRATGEAEGQGDALSANAFNPVTSYSVAVLAFANLSTPAHAFLADGITRDLTSLLSRVPRLRVAAYSSASAGQYRRMPLVEIAQVLDVRYVVSGSLTLRGKQLLLRVALMDATTNSQLWSKRIDQSLEAFYAVEDELVLDISTSILSEMQTSEAASIRERRVFDLSCYELIQSAETLRSLYSREAADKIIALLSRALKLEPENAAVHAALATQYAQNVASNWTRTPVETLAQARAHVTRALKLTPNDSDVLMAAGIVATFNGDAELAVRRLGQSHERDPNNAHALAMLGWQSCWLTGSAEGIAMIEAAESRAPHHPRHALWALYRGLGLVRLGRLEEAISAYRISIDRNPNYFLSHAHLACAFALADRVSEASETLKRMLTLAPDYTLDDYERLMTRHRLMYAPPYTLEKSIAVLRKAWPHGQTVDGAPDA